MQFLTALKAVISGTHDNSRGLLRWKPALWSALAGALTAAVSAVMGFHILAAVFLWTAATFLFLTVIGIGFTTAARLKETPNA
jgi:O-antigen/teichoic acid export membrane protein